MLYYLHMKPFLTGIAGPSGAGKSLFCRHFQKRYTNVSRLKFDDFFKDLEDVPNVGESKDWDNPSNIKWNELLQAVRDLKSGRYAVVPNYSRMHRSDDWRKMRLPCSDHACGWIYDIDQRRVARTH